MDWQLDPGEVIKRTELHDAFGGGRQGGISPSQEGRDLKRQPVRALTAAEIVELGAMLRGVTEAMRQTALPDEALQRGT